MGAGQNRITHYYCSVMELYWLNKKGAATHYKL